MSTQSPPRDATADDMKVFPLIFLRKQAYGSGIRQETW